MPWIPQVVLSALIQELADAKAATDLANTRTEAAHIRYADLALKCAELADRQIVDAPKLTPRTRDEVIDAILARAGSNGQIRAMLSTWAAKQRRENVPEDKIIEGIMVWASPEEDETF